jgi:hypothetical protein
LYQEPFAIGKASRRVSPDAAAARDSLPAQTGRGPRERRPPLCHFDFRRGLAEAIEPQLGRGTRPAEQITLRVRAAGGAHEQKLVAGFDAFGNGVDAEIPAETRDRRHDRRAVVALGEFVQKDRSIFILSNGNMRK